MALHPKLRAPPCDIIIHRGDLARVGGLSAYKQAMQDIQTIDAELKLLLDLEEGWVCKNAKGGEEDEDVEDSRKCFEFMESHAEERLYYLEEGRYGFKLKNGRRLCVWVSTYTPELNGYVFAYKRKQRSVRDIPEDTHVFITRGPRSFTRDVGFGLDVNGKREKDGCKMLGDAVKRVTPRVHCFWTCARGERCCGQKTRTILVNAAV